MAQIIHKRTIRTSTRKVNSPYKVDTKRVTSADSLVVKINHETKSFGQDYYFKGKDLARKDSIHFSVDDQEELRIIWHGVQPTLIPEPTIINIQPEWFKMGYYVYLVVMDYKGKKFFYIGVTGDRKYKVARSPFYRMGGHFSQLTSSTQNQLIQGIKARWAEEADMEALLETIRFTYYAYCIRDFDKGDVTNHDIHRRHVEKIESYLIERMEKEYGKYHIFNKHKSAKTYTDIEVIGDQILKDIKERLK